MTIQPIYKRLSITVHVLGSAIFLLIAFLASPEWPYLGRILNNPIGFRDFVFQLEILAFFYLNYYFFIDKFYLTRRYLRYFSIVLLCFILFIPVTNLLVEHLHPHVLPRFPFPKKDPPFFGFFFGMKLYLFLLVLAFSLLLKIWQNFEKVKKEKTSAELSFLKSQINPHFLFNTLNSIYSLAIQHSKDTPDAILRLSSMMRYVLKDTEQDYVSLEKEIAYVNDYVALQKLRLDERVFLRVVCEGEFSGWKIAPLVLIPYIENAFKYGVNAEEESSIEIIIRLNKNVFTLAVSNTKVNTTFSSDANTGLGLANAEKRLDLLYSKKHELHITDDTQRFSVYLSMELT